MSGEIPVQIAANFERNLDALREYLVEHDAEPQFDRLIDELFDEMIPNLSRFPLIGTDVTGRKPASLQGAAKRETLIRRLGEESELRLYIHRDYLVLYLLNPQGVVLLAIEHHLQLGFDVKEGWV